MKKTTMMVMTVLIIGCGNEAEAKTTEIRSNDKVVVIPNTEHIDYQAYRQEWRRVNDKPAPRWAPDFTLTTKTRKDPENSYEIIEMELSDLSFKDAFRIEFLGKGEGHTFWWRGDEYTTNLLDVIRQPGFKMTDPFIERIVRPNVKKDVVKILEEALTPVEGE